MSKIPSLVIAFLFTISFAHAGEVARVPDKGQAVDAFARCLKVKADWINEGEIAQLAMTLGERSVLVNAEGVRMVPATIEGASCEDVRMRYSLGFVVPELRDDDIWRRGGVARIERLSKDIASEIEDAKSRADDNPKQD